jgi:hypothetical protein
MASTRHCYRDSGRRPLAKIDAHIATLNKDIAAAQGDVGLRTACLKPLEALKEQVQKAREPWPTSRRPKSKHVKGFDARNWIDRTGSQGG